MKYKKVFLKMERKFPKEGEWCVGISTNGYQWTIFISFSKKKYAVSLKRVLTIFLECRDIIVIDKGVIE